MLPKYYIYKETSFVLSKTKKKRSKYNVISCITNCLLGNSVFVYPGRCLLVPGIRVYLSSGKFVSDLQIYRKEVIY